MSKARISTIILLVVLASCTSLHSKKIEIHLPEWFMFSLLKLQVVPSFDPPKIYEVSRNSPHWLRVSVYEGAGGYDWGDVAEEKHLNITDSEHEQIVNYLESALDMPTRDDTLGLDGSTWVLETSLYQYVKYAVWTPGYKASERGYESLIALEEFLHNLEHSYD